MLRPAGREDVVRLADLDTALFGVDAWSEPVILGELEGPGRYAVVAVDGAGGREELVGFAVTMHIGDVVDLQRLGVRPERRRGGVAGRLLDHVLEHASTRGADRMLLEVSAVNTAALAFYAAAGFARIGLRRGYYRDGSDAVILQRALGGDAAGSPDHGLGRGG